jgi:hypothetical protein
MGTHFKKCWWGILFASSYLVIFGQENRPVISHKMGQCFLQLKRNPLPKPQAIDANQTIDQGMPFALITSPNSFLEFLLEQDTPDTLIRLGRSTALELQPEASYALIKGSALFLNREKRDWRILSGNSQFKFSGSGTWLMETTSLGFKLILLEGQLSYHDREAQTQKTVHAGELVLITGEEGAISQSIKVELPTLLATSRLINLFPAPLPSESRLISAAQVQAMRTKVRYDAFIGGVSEDRKLRVWSRSSKNSE